MAIAYLVGFVDFGGSRVRWSGCGIFSEPAPTSAYCTFIIISEVGKDFAEARRKIMLVLDRTGRFAGLAGEVVRYDNHRVGCAGCFFDRVTHCAAEDVEAPPGHSGVAPSCWQPCETADESMPTPLRDGIGLVKGRTYRMSAEGRAFDMRLEENGNVTVLWADTGTSEGHIPPGEHGVPEVERGKLPPSAEKKAVLLAIRKATLEEKANNQTTALSDVLHRMICNYTDTDWAKGQISVVEAIDQELRGSYPLFDATCASWHPSRPLLLAGHKTGVVYLLEWFPEAKYFEPREVFILFEMSERSVQAVWWMGEGRAFGARAGPNSTTRIIEESDERGLGEVIEPRTVSADGNWIVMPHENGFEIKAWVGRGNI